MHEHAEHAPAARPGWITSIGALAGLVLGALSYVQQNGQQIEAQHRTDIGEAHLGDAQRRIWDAIEKDRTAHAADLQHLREYLRAEIVADLRREIDLRCHDGSPSQRCGSTHVQ